MKNIIFISLISLLFINCGSSKMADPAQVAATESLIESKNYRIVQEQAQPLNTLELNKLANAGFFVNGDTAQVIYLTDRNDHITVANDSLQLEMSFYGETRMPMTRTGDISFNVGQEVPEDYEVSFNEKKNEFTIQFSAKNNVEQLITTITVYPNGKTVTYVNSSHRSTVRYIGRIEKVTQA